MASETIAAYLYLGVGDMDFIDDYRFGTLTRLPGRAPTQSE